MRLLVCVAIVGMLFVNVERAEGHANQCSTWGTMAGKEGRVRDSLHMHLLGCDSNPWTLDTHYDAYDMGECARVARAIVRSNPTYFVYRPWTVARHVEEARPWCYAFEDGSYGDMREWR